MSLHRTVLFAALVICSVGLSGETLADALRTANVPARPFTADELAREITSPAVSEPMDDPFLVAYYIYNGADLLPETLHVIRYQRSSGTVQRAELRNIHAQFRHEIEMDCMGAAISIIEVGDTIYIDTHYNPSAGCLILLSTNLSYRFAVSGWLAGTLGRHFAIVEGSEVHFQSVHPLHIEVWDLHHNTFEPVYPPQDSPLRRKFSTAIKPLIDENWCREANAGCDPEDFNTSRNEEALVNEAAGVFALSVDFNADGFSDDSGERLRPVRAAYVYRRRGGHWEHREFLEKDIQRLYGVASLADLIAKKPLAPFAR